jgi:hypothetical protein
MVKNGTSYEKNGWKYVSVSGNPKERGYAYGYICANDFKEIQKTLHFLMIEAYGLEWEYFIENINKDFKELTKRDFKEFYERKNCYGQVISAAINFKTYCFIKEKNNLNVQNDKFFFDNEFDNFY